MEKNPNRPSWQKLMLNTAHVLGLPVIHANCLALYSNENSNKHQLSKCFEIIINQFTYFNKKPDLIGVDNRKEMVSYEKGIKKIHTIKWDDADSIDIKASRISGGFVTGWSISTSMSSKFGYLVFCVCNDLMKDNPEYFLNLALSLSKYFKVDYGIFYKRRLSLGADLYAVGITSGLSYSNKDKLEIASIAKWFNAEGYFKKNNDFRANHLRNVFPMNILRDVHLKQLVDGKTLQEWIQTSPSRGELRALADDKSIWNIEDKNISSIRKELIKNNLLVEFDPKIPPFDR